MDVRALADGDAPTGGDDGAVPQADGLRDGDEVIGGGDADGAVYGGAHAEGLADDRIEVGKFIEGFSVTNPGGGWRGRTPAVERVWGGWTFAAWRGGKEFVAEAGLDGGVEGEVV
jgi:hypothetical protein